VPNETESSKLNFRIMRFLMLCPVRPSNVCYLRWRNIKEDEGVIEYLGKRRDPVTGEWLDSEHKNGWKYPKTRYIVPLTDNLRAEIEESRQQQIKEGVEIKPDGFVFIHGKTRFGLNHWDRKPSCHRTIDDYLHKAVDRLRAQGETVRIVPENGK